ncbi:MAG TPA: HAMP domain-containing histidine kinase [Gammaproteobacteria bacterium]|nr:HAMP domain-containing histidine kinase [Gammaproteobacteria bacterium]
MKLHETSAFRLALKFSGLFSLITTIAFASVYFITVQELKAQIDQELVHELAELTTHYNQFGQRALLQHVKNRQHYGQALHHYYAVSDTTYQHLSGNQFLTSIVRSNKISHHQIRFIDALDIDHGIDDNERLRIASQQLDNRFILTTGQSNASIEELQEHILSAVVIANIVSILSALAIGLYMSRQALANISNINQGLERSINSNFKDQLPLPVKSDEYRELVLKLNLMLRQIGRLLTGMRRVTDNIAHDLRSPLTRMRNRLEVTLLQPRDTKEYQHVMEKAVSDCSELLSTFNALLSIAQAEAGIRGNQWQTLDISCVVDELADMYQSVAEEQQLSFDWIKPEAITIEGNRQLLAQAISNLLENAIKYTPAGGAVSLQVMMRDNAPVVEVSDTGPGIPDKDKTIVVERFRRLDSARNSPGNGLGLSFVNAVVKLHNAHLIFLDNHPGLRARIIFRGKPYA